MARYRKVDVSVWIDQRFRRLAPMPPSSRSLWLYLLTNPSTTSIPGIYRAGEASISEDLEWPLEAFREAFAEISREGLAEADWKARVIWLPRATKYNQPESPNVVKSWRTPWQEIPDCALKEKAFQHLKVFAKGIGEAFLQAFLKACAQPVIDPSAKGFRESVPNPSWEGCAEVDVDPSPNQEQDQEQVLSARDPRYTGHDLEVMYGEERAEAVEGALPWKTPRSTDGKAEEFAAKLSPEEQADARPTMKLHFAELKAGKGKAGALENPTYGFGCWRGDLTRLRERLHGKTPPRPRPDHDAPRPETNEQGLAAIARLTASNDVRNGS